MTITAATVLGVTVGALLTNAIAGLAAGAGTAIAFRFVLQAIITRK